jgi:hypothetical protein
MIRQSTESSGVTINMLSTPEIARDLNFCTCALGYSVGGRADPVGRWIYINADHSRATQRQSLQHELGHYFFGRGHPSRPGQLGWGGVMDYRIQRVRQSDREHFLDLYGRQ